ERQTDARSKLVVTILHSRLARETGVAGIQKPGRGILENRTLDALPKAIQAEVINSSVVQTLRQKGFPPESEVCRQTTRNLPGVLRIQAVIPFVREDRVRTALRHRLYLAEQEIQHADTRSVSGKSETR